MVRTPSWILRSIGLSAGGLLAFMVAMMIFPGQLWTIFSGDPDLGEVQFDRLERPGSPNTYLICPADMCSGAHPDAVSRIYGMPAPALYDAALQAWSRQPDVTVVMDDKQGLRARFIQRTAWLKFPDTVSMQVFPSGERVSTLAVYSRSQIGYGDFGANRKRVDHWLSLLE